MTAPLEPFEMAVAQFPQTVREHLFRIPLQQGVVPREQAIALADLLDVDAQGLAVRLVPLAVALARPVLSRFPVGAVAVGERDEAGTAALYLGANLEIENVPLSTTVHAEQSATINAWHHGETTISALVVSAVPCGHCRQFLWEIHSAESIRILLPAKDASPPQNLTLADLLPEAFALESPGRDVGWMIASSGAALPLGLEEHTDDELVLRAFEAGRCSYAPYTRNHAGCALRTKAGHVVVGRYAENVALNPSVSAIRSALSLLNLGSHRGEITAIERVVLVERTARVSQRSVTQAVVSALAPDADVSYHRAT